jgi:serine/threonine-protein kinase RsbW
MKPSDQPTGTVADVTIRSDPARLAEVREVVRRMANQCGFGSHDTDGITLAVDEALANVIKHGYGGAPHGMIEIHLEVLSPVRPGLEVRIRDQGCQVDPAAIQGRDLADVRPGGLGVHIIRTVMDDLSYERCPDGGMSVTMRKYLQPPQRNSAE